MNATPKRTFVSLSLGLKKKIYQTGFSIKLSNLKCAKNYQGRDVEEPHLALWCHSPE